jgi:hypothetical protein
MTLEMELPYQKALSGILAFSTFAEAEQTLKSLEKIYRNYEAASDKKGMEYCRQIASLGRRRAEQISRNKKVSLQKQLQKKEIATWFMVWLETPAILRIGFHFARTRKSLGFSQIPNVLALQKPGDCNAPRSKIPWQPKSFPGRPAFGDYCRKRKFSRMDPADSSAECRRQSFPVGNLA